MIICLLDIFYLIYYYYYSEMRYNHFTFVDNEIAYFDVLDTSYKVNTLVELVYG